MKRPRSSTSVPSRRTRSRRQEKEANPGAGHRLPVRAEHQARDPAAGAEAQVSVLVARRRGQLEHLLAFDHAGGRGLQAEAAGGQTGQQVTAVRLAGGAGDGGAARAHHPEGGAVLLQDHGGACDRLVPGIEHPALQGHPGAEHDFAELPLFAGAQRRHPHAPLHPVAARDVQPMALAGLDAREMDPAFRVRPPSRRLLLGLVLPERVVEVEGDGPGEIEGHAVVVLETHLDLADRLALGVHQAQTQGAGFAGGARQPSLGAGVSGVQVGPARLLHLGRGGDGGGGALDAVGGGGAGLEAGIHAPRPVSDLWIRSEHQVAEASDEEQDDQEEQVPVHDLGSGGKDRARPAQATTTSVVLRWRESGCPFREPDPDCGNPRTHEFRLSDTPHGLALFPASG